MSGSSSWNTSPWSFSPNTNVNDRESMPSDKAEAARQKAAEVMATLKKGEPGDADKLMGKEERNGAATVLPLSWMARKFSGSKKEKEEKVVR